MFYLFHLFRSFLPLHNPIGYGAADFIELAIAVMLVLFAVAARYGLDPLRRLAERPGWSMALLFVLPIALRLALLPVHPIPSPGVSDDFSYLLAGDTLSHFRLANPSHPMHRFFETLYVLQEPAYSSIYSLGQGIALAIGKWIFGAPWAGIALSAGALAALCYWMLRAWTTAGWSLVGGVLAAVEFGPLNHWMNTYWGGAVSGIAGCLVFGALPRLRAEGRVRDAVLLGTGIGMQLLSRPFESVFLMMSVTIFVVPLLVSGARLMKPLAIAALTLLPVVFLTARQNRQVTGSWTTMPYQLSRYQYGVPTTFTVQPNPVPHRELTPQQQIAYEVQSSVHGAATDTFRSFFDRLAGRVRFYRFFILAPLYLALPAFVGALRKARFRWVATTILLFAIGTNFYPYFYPHYVAALTCLLVLISVVALERLSRVTIREHATGLQAAQVIIFLCLAHFTFWYGLHLFGKEDFAVAAWRFEPWDTINYGDPEGRIAIHDRLAAMNGEQLVFVRYAPKHTLQEWVYNDADIDRSRIVWARDLGPEENETLRRYYPNRAAWLLAVDARPLQLIPYAEPKKEAPPVAPQPESPARPAPKTSHPQLKFEEVR